MKHPEPIRLDQLRVLTEDDIACGNCPSTEPMWEPDGWVALADIRQLLRDNGIPFVEGVE